MSLRRSEDPITSVRAYIKRRPIALWWGSEVFNMQRSFDMPNDVDESNRVLA
ncbi:hypothetical protein IF2G_06649 [Cordyceps javanica]|nr:hypothetical protein IF2G_06649 [Cordyceps javanica]